MHFSVVVRRRGAGEGITLPEGGTLGQQQGRFPGTKVTSTTSAQARPQPTWSPLGAVQLLVPWLTQQSQSIPPTTLWWGNQGSLWQGWYGPMSQQALGRQYPPSPRFFQIQSSEIQGGAWSKAGELWVPRGHTSPLLPSGVRTQGGGSPT